MKRYDLRFIYLTLLLVLFAKTSFPQTAQLASYLRKTYETFTYFILLLFFSLYLI